MSISSTVQDGRTLSLPTWLKKDLKIWFIDDLDAKKNIDKNRSRSGATILHFSQNIECFAFPYPGHVTTFNELELTNTKANCLMISGGGRRYDTSYTAFHESKLFSDSVGGCSIGDRSQGVDLRCLARDASNNYVLKQECANVVFGDAFVSLEKNVTARSEAHPSPQFRFRGVGVGARGRSPVANKSLYKTGQSFRWTYDVNQQSYWNTTPEGKNNTGEKIPHTGSRECFLGVHIVNNSGLSIKGSNPVQENAPLPANTNDDENNLVVTLMTNLRLTDEEKRRISFDMMFRLNGLRQDVTGEEKNMVYIVSHGPEQPFIELTNRDAFVNAANTIMIAALKDTLTQCYPSDQFLEQPSEQKNARSVQRNPTHTKDAISTVSSSSSSPSSSSKKIKKKKKYKKPPSPSPSSESSEYNGASYSSSASYSPNASYSSSSSSSIQQPKKKGSKLKTKKTKVINPKDTKKKSKSKSRPVTSSSSSSSSRKKKRVKKKKRISSSSRSSVKKPVKKTKESKKSKKRIDSNSVMDEPSGSSLMKATGDTNTVTEVKKLTPQEYKMKLMNVPIVNKRQEEIKDREAFGLTATAPPAKIRVPQSPSSTPSNQPVRPMSKFGAPRIPASHSSLLDK